MCIPFGMKDHHQIADEPTSYGNILFYKSSQTVPSTVVHQLMSYGAIPIAKMTMGSLAWGPVHGWGQTMSPTLMADSGGSSTGSGSAVSVGALPFAVSEETWGSIASPSACACLASESLPRPSRQLLTRATRAGRRNLISGHIPSYGGTSRGGAGLLSSETDHIGFHTRHLKDFALLYNYMRTGVDPLDGDTVAIEMQNPAQMDLSTIKVLIVEGDFEWTYNNESIPLCSANPGLADARQACETHALGPHIGTAGNWGYAPGSVPASYGGLSAWKCANWFKMASTLSGDTATSASLDHLEAQAAPTQPRAQPERLEAYHGLRTSPQAGPIDDSPLPITRWAERVERIKGALTAAGIPFETKNMSAMAAAFEDYSADPLYPDSSIGMPRLLLERQASSSEMPHLTRRLLPRVRPRSERRSRQRHGHQPAGGHDAGVLPGVPARAHQLQVRQECGLRHLWLSQELPGQDGPHRAVPTLPLRQEVPQRPVLVQVRRGHPLQLGQRARLPGHRGQL